MPSLGRSTIVQHCMPLGHTCHGVCPCIQGSGELAAAFFCISVPFSSTASAARSTVPPVGSTHAQWHGMVRQPRHETTSDGSLWLERWLMGRCI